MSNQRRNLTLKQRRFWIDSKNNLFYYIVFLYNTELFILTLKRTVFERRNNVSLSTLNQHRSFTLK